MSYIYIYIQLQVTVVGQNVLQSTLQYNYEHFLEQVHVAEQLTFSHFGVSTGLINQGYRENSKWHFVNVERGNLAATLQPRNTNVSFLNSKIIAIMRRIEWCSCSIVTN